MCDWSSDVCSSDLRAARISARFPDRQCRAGRAGRTRLPVRGVSMRLTVDHTTRYTYDGPVGYALQQLRLTPKDRPGQQQVRDRSEEHTSELQSLMRISYAVFCLKKKK